MYENETMQNTANVHISIDLYGFCFGSDCKRKAKILFKKKRSNKDHASFFHLLQEFRSETTKNGQLYVLTNVKQISIQLLENAMAQQQIAEWLATA